jgi:glycosyltransferase involved in cell wall biosynthesis
MRILWLTNHFRAHALVRRDEFLDVGVEMMLVSTNRGFSRYSGPVREYETVLLGRPAPWADWLPCYKAYRAAEKFNPDVVVTENVSDPRWKYFARSAPRINAIHDAEPHDGTHKVPVWHRLMFDRWNSRADATLVFSQYVSSSLAAAGTDVSKLWVVPLHTEVDPTLVPDPVTADERKNFIMFGRQDPYKNHATIFTAWEAHVASSSWRGDELVIYGDGEIPRPLPSHARWVRGQFQYKDVIEEFARAKGSIVHHTEGASQSAVQVLSMQLGVPTLVSTGGALPEYQPDGLNVTGVNDVDGLSRAISALADPNEADRQSRIVLEHFKDNFDAGLFVKRFTEVANHVIRQCNARPPGH